MKRCKRTTAIWQESFDLFSKGWNKVQVMKKLGLRGTEVKSYYEIWQLYEGGLISNSEESVAKQIKMKLTSLNSFINLISKEIKSHPSPSVIETVIGQITEIRVSLSKLAEEIGKVNRVQNLGSKSARAFENASNFVIETVS